MLDGEVVSAPSVSQRAHRRQRRDLRQLHPGRGRQNLANMLSYGALPLSFKEQSVTTVTAALGGEQLHAGLIAGAIGLALVVIYLVVYYRGLALVAIASLLVSAILTYAIMALLGPAIGFALNLPAVCGAIVAIGITADSFIVYFERIRDEIREGRTLRPAVERAWPRARRTILVSDFVSFLAAAVLFIVTVGKVQGFAFTLGLTTVLDVVVVFLFTKPLMTLLARTEVLRGAVTSGPASTRSAWAPSRRCAAPAASVRPRRPEGGVRCRNSATLGARLHRGEVGYDFVGKRKIWYGISILITITAILGLAVRGLNMGIEFKGGAVFTTPKTQRLGRQGRGVRARRPSGHDAIVQKLGNGSLRIQIAGSTPTQSDAVKHDLAKDLKVDPRDDQRGPGRPQLGRPDRQQGLEGLAIFMVLVVIYLAIAFEWRMAIAALVALIHDLTITIGVYALVGFEVTPGTVIGLLTILGYSLYDTVVVFDGLKESTKDITKQTRYTYSEIANRALNGTLVRSINTTVVALLPVGGLLFIGGGFLGAGMLNDISLSLFVGLAAGAYSSIFIATPLVADLKEREPQMKALKKRVLAKRAQAAAAKGESLETRPRSRTTTSRGRGATRSSAPQPARVPRPRPRPSLGEAPMTGHRGAAAQPHPGRGRLPGAGRDVQGHHPAAGRPGGLHGA